MKRLFFVLLAIASVVAVLGAQPKAVHFKKLQ